MKRKIDVPPKEFKDRIIEAAMEVFSSESFDKATVRKISSKAGVSASTIYVYYPSKLDLLLGIFHSRLKELTAYIERGMLGIDRPSEKIRKFAWSFIDYFEQNRAFGCLLYENTPLTLVWSDSHAVELMKEQTLLFITILSEGQQRGDFKSDINPPFLNYVFFGALARTVVINLLRDDWSKVKEEAYEISNITLSAIEKPDERIQFICPLLEEKSSDMRH